MFELQYPTKCMEWAHNGTGNTCIEHNLEENSASWDWTRDILNASRTLLPPNLVLHSQTLMRMILGMWN